MSKRLGLSGEGHFHPAILPVRHEKRVLELHAQLAFRAIDRQRRARGMHVGALVAAVTRTADDNGNPPPIRRCGPR